MHDTQRCKIALARRSRSVAAFGLLLAWATGAAAQACGTGAETACGYAPPLSRDTLQSRVDRTLAVDPTQHRSTARLNRSPGQGATAPFAIRPDGDKTNFSTSLTQWGSAFSAADTRKIEEAKNGFAKDLALPKPVRTQALALDVWAESRREEFREERDRGKRSNTQTTYVGADYRLKSKVLFGAMVQFDDTQKNFSTARDGVETEAYMAGPYVAYRVTPNLTLGARAAWGGANDSTYDGARSASFATSRALTQAHVNGNWDLGKWKLMQSTAVTYVDETAVASASGLNETSIDATRFSTGPELKRPIDAGDGNSVEPFAFFKTSLELDDPRVRPDTARNTLGGGLMLSKPESYSIRATAERSESVGALTPDEEMTGKVSVSVPLP